MRNMTVFAVDDEENVLALYESILGQQKSKRLDFFDSLEEKEVKNICDLHTFQRGEEYLQALSEHYKQGKRVPLSIVDMRLPGIHGLEVAKAARKIDKDMTIIIVTAYSDYTVEELMGQLEYRVYYVRKPFKSDELYALVHSNLNEWNENLQALSLQKELAIDATEDGLWSWNPITNVTYFSARWKQMIGYAENEIENVFGEWYERVHPDDKERVMSAIQAHFEKKTSYLVTEHRLRSKDGSYKWILDRGKALFNEKGEPYKMIGFHTDITERKRLEDELNRLNQSLSQEVRESISQQAKLTNTNTELERKLKLEIIKRREKEEMLLSQTRQAAMGEMISMIAHQWRQPLTVIGIIADNISLDLQLDTLNADRLAESLSDIGSQVKYLSQTIDDFRQFFLPNKAKESLLVSDCIESSLQIIGKSLANHNVTLEKHYTDTTPIALYKNELIQVFINLLKNAQDAFMDVQTKQPKIILSTKEYETYVEVTIEDNAGGITEEVQKQIFQPYFTTKSKKNGTGLGLYISKTIIEEHSCGTIEMQNTKEGALFTLTFLKKCIERKLEIFEDKEEQ